MRRGIFKSYALRLASLLIAVSAVQIGLPSNAQTPSNSDRILFAPSNAVTIAGSKFGALASFQTSLLQAAGLCHISVAHPDRFADGRLGQATMRLVSEVASCPLYQERFGAAPPAHGQITTTFWTAIAPDLPVPTSLERAISMSLGAEATDYTTVEFNVGTSDPGILTWGPQGATAGQAFQVQRILRTIDTELPDVIDDAFGAEANAVRTLAATQTENDASDFVNPIAAAPDRKAQWLLGFEKLGADARVRSIYDRLMNAQGTAGIPEAVKDFFRSYWAQGWCPTEVDQGFFFDRAVQLDVRRAKTDQAVADVVAIDPNESFTPAQRRRAISANFWAGATSWVGDRLARDVEFYIDLIPRDQLTDPSLRALTVQRTNHSPPALLNGELPRWESRSNFTAADYGLSDDVFPAPPYDLQGEPRACTNLHA